jgi:hypothetical protein
MNYSQEFKVTSHDIAKEILALRIEKRMTPEDRERKYTMNLLSDHDNTSWMQPC